MTDDRLASELGALLNELDRAVAATFGTSRIHPSPSNRGKATGRRQRLRGALLALFGRRRAQARFRAAGR